MVNFKVEDIGITEKKGTAYLFDIDLIERAILCVV